MYRHLWIFFSLAVLATTPLRAAVTLNGDFDHGSLDESASFVSGDFVQLAGRDNYNAGQWKWLYFSANGVQGQQLTFRIDDDFPGGGSRLNNHEMVYSYDQDNWFFFDNNARSSSADTYTFSNDSAFTSDQVWVAYGLPYSIDRLESHTAGVAASPWVSPTATGGSDLVIGQSPGGIDDIGRVIPQQDLYGYRVTDPSSDGPKAKIVLLGGTHSNETLANLTLEALVDYLVSDELDAALLRRRAEFFVYPMANPDGRLAGYNRSTVQFPDLDPNRHWDAPHYDGLTDIRAVGEAIIADTGGDADIFLDFHSTVDPGSSHFVYTDIDKNMHLHPYWQQVLQLEPTIATFDAALQNDTGAKFGYEQLGVGFTGTFETRFIAGENEDRFVTLGENFGKAFAALLATPYGDLNFDGDVDADDYAVLTTHAETSTAGLTTAEAYAAGDLNNDGWNDALDFGLFKETYVATHGAQAFALMIAGVPEPSTLTVALVAAISLIIRRRSPAAAKPY
ncbi:Zinc carboxypeptidase [Pseudobythopirellula maris]|uniref:Zinc carboxypeptidase n=1 Tax=Pseudobythopirellula maris TaxID=2527991 RepID=A0A5C5ZRZ5_9BACT|nr:M14-type cytosolic carboxypeptidase [Pseudobythopirellula maris]TWT90312.1 Zinc carboxypeptidase [Pseudobythopirellula maris]